MAVRVIELGIVPVIYGLPKELVGDLTHYLDDPLDPARWPEIAKWVGPPEEELLLVTLGVYQPNIAAAVEALDAEGFAPKGFPQLMAIKDRMAELWSGDPRVPYVAAPHPDGYWRDDDGDLYVPYLNCDPDYRNLSAYWVGRGWNEDDWFLAVRK